MTLTFLMDKNIRIFVDNIYFLKCRHGDWEEIYSFRVYINYLEIIDDIVDIDIHQISVKKKKKRANVKILSDIIVIIS